MKHRKAVRTGRWGSYSSTNVNGLQKAIEDTLREYGDLVYQATEDGITAAAYVLSDELKQASPEIKNPPRGYSRKNFGKHWKVTGIGKYKLMRFVGNTTTVQGKEDPIALTNIIEYSTTRGHPFVKRTFDASVEKMAAAAVAAIKKEV